MKMKKVLKPRNLLCFFPGTLQSIEKLKILENHTCSKKKLFSLIFTVSARKKMKEGEIKINWDIKNSFLIWNI